MSVTVFNVCRGLGLSIMNLRFSYANYEHSLHAVKKSKALISKLINYSHLIT
jgi:hypothetical protein